MHVFGKLLSWLLWLLLLAVVLVLLTALAWWMEWPLVTGVVLLVGALGVVLAFFGLRALYRWRDKRRFVRKVLDEQTRMEGEAPTSGGRLADVWRQGMELLRRSPLRFHERVQYSQPWFVTLDETGGSSTLFESFGNTLPEQSESPLYWHFLSSLVILRCPDTGKMEGEWEELLASLARNKRKIPLRGIVLLLSVDDLIGNSDEAFSVLGQRLRSRVQQVMLTLNRRYPVYVLVQGLESMPGMDDILDVVEPSALDMPLGLLLANDMEEAGRRAAASAAQSLEEAVRSAAAEGRLPHGDMLKGIRELRFFGDKLELAIENLTREVAHQMTPLLRGVFFCQFRSGGEKRPGFLAEVLARILPAAGQPKALSGGLPFYASTKIVLMTAWLALTLFICGLLAVNTIYQHHILTVEATANIVDVSHDELFNTLYAKMLYAKRLEQARKAWCLPSFGQNMLLRVEQKVKEDFIIQVNAHILSPMLSNFQTFLARPATAKDGDMEMDVARELTWLCSAVSDRIELGKLPQGTRAAFPLTRMDENHWSPVTGQLLINALNWTPDGEQLNALAQNMRSLLTMSFTRKGANLFNTFVENINRNLPAAEICLSQFWPHMEVASGGEQCIPSAYTASGYAAIRDTLEDIESIAENNEALQQQLSVFRSAYFKRYAQLWYEFVTSFSGVGSALQQGDVFATYADAKSIEEVPHMRLFRKMALELAPFRDAESVPAWVSRFSTVDTVTEIALAQHHDGAGASRWRALFSAVGTSPELLQRLRAETKDAQHLRELLLAAGSLHQYFDKSLELLQTLANPSKSLALASIHYGTRGRGEPAEDSPYTEAQTSFSEAFASFHSEVQSPARRLLYGILDFVVQGVTVQTARTLQHDWENEVLSSPAALYRQDDVEALFGDKGVVQDFANTRLKPFLARQDKELVAARWGNVAFPFTADFLGLLARAEIIAAEPPKDTYYVLLRSQPTLVNVDARERPDFTEVSLQCQDRETRLVNRNYPRDERFQYTVAQCGRTSLELRFPSFTLRRDYSSFTEFLQDFEYGERIFGPEDFPDEVVKMQEAGVRSITVRILPDNVADVLHRRANQPPALPDRITYAW